MRQFTDVADWYLPCPPVEIELIEIGLVNEREEPGLLMLDAPLPGQVSANDRMSFKVWW